MEKRIKEYLAKADALIERLGAGKTEPSCDIDDILAEHLTQIGFFSHERLIHLIVTALFAILEVVALFMSLVTGSIAATVLTVAILVLLVPYVRHYYILENSVQRMYSQYDALLRFKRGQGKDTGTDTADSAAKIKGKENK